MNSKSAFFFSFQIDHITIRTMLGILIGLLTLLSSATVPIVVARYEHLHTAANIHASALCVSDCVIGAMTSVYTLARQWPAVNYSPGVCMVVVFVTSFCTIISTWQMFWLALDRRTALHYPLSYPELVTTDTVRGELLITLFTAVVLNTFIITMRLLTEPPFRPELLPKCLIIWQVVMGDCFSMFQIVGFIVVFATIALTVDILLLARRVLRSDVVAMPQELPERAMQRQHLRTFFYLLRVFVLYGVCLVPFNVYTLVTGVSDDDRLEPLAMLLLVLRSLFNILDTWLFCSNPELRQAILHYLCASRFNLYP